MEILGIGPLEFLLILLIALIVLGPNDMVKAGRTIGRFLRRIVTSQEWRTVQQVSKEIRYLPNRLMRESSLEELQKNLDLNKIGRDTGLDQIQHDLRTIQKDISAWTTPPPDEPSQAKHPGASSSADSSGDPPSQSTDPGSGQG